MRDTNECHVYVTVEERGRVMAFSAIDNIWKGASSQGVQNLNLMLGLDETEGLRERLSGAKRSTGSSSSGRAGSRRRPGSRSSIPPSWRPASAPAAPTAGSRAAAAPTSA